MAILTVLRVATTKGIRIDSTTSSLSMTSSLSVMRGRTLRKTLRKRTLRKRTSRRIIGTTNAINSSVCLLSPLGRYTLLALFP